MTFDYGWDKYLSARDKEHDKLWGKTELAGFGSKPALVLIDMYYSVVGFERLPIFESMKTWPGSTGLEGWAAIDQTVALVAAARACGIPVIHVKGLETDIAPWMHVKRGSAQTMSPEMKQKGAQIVDEVKPIEGEIVIEKAAASAFQGTALSFHLNGLGIDTVICCGETTSGCVRALKKCRVAPADMQKLRVCYGVSQEFPETINITDKGRPVTEAEKAKLAEGDVAAKEHVGLCELLESLGATVHNLASDAPFPDMVYTYDPALVTRDGAILLRSGKPERVGEEDVLGEWFDHNGIPIVGRIEAPGTVDGGDVLWLRPDLV